MASCEKRSPAHFVRAHRACACESCRRAFLAACHQGPKALGILQRFTKVPLDSIKYITLLPAPWTGRMPHRAHGIHWRRRLRDLLRSKHSEKLWSNLLEAGNGARLIALRPGSAKHPASGSVYWPDGHESTTPRRRGRQAWAGSAAGKGRISRTRNSNPPKQQKAWNELSSGLKCKIADCP